MMNHLPMPTFGPLAGVRVVFFRNRNRRSGFAGQMFAEWGALRLSGLKRHAWADTIRVQPNYPQLSRRNLRTPCR